MLEPVHRERMSSRVNCDRSKKSKSQGRLRAMYGRLRVRGSWARITQSGRRSIIELWGRGVDAEVLFLVRSRERVSRDRSPQSYDQPTACNSCKEKRETRFSNAHLAILVLEREESEYYLTDSAVATLIAAMLSITTTPIAFISTKCELCLMIKSHSCLRLTCTYAVSRANYCQPCVLYMQRQ